MGSQIFIKGSTFSQSFSESPIKTQPKVTYLGQFMRKYQALGRFFWICFCKKHIWAGFFFSLHKEQTTVLPLLAEKHMPVYAIFMLYKRKQQNRWVYLSIKTQCKSCIFVFIYLGIRELISFKSADQEAAGKWILSPLAGGTGSREQRPEEVRRAGQR